MRGEKQAGREMCCRDIIAGLQQLVQISERDGSFMVPEQYPAGD